MLLIITCRVSSRHVPSIGKAFLEMAPLVVVENVKNAPHASRMALLEMDRGAFIPCMLLHRQHKRITGKC